MPEKSVGRNDPCPCGSGKKYKKCCLGKDQRPPSPQASTAISPFEALAQARKEYFEEGWDKLDEISNGAVDAIHAKRFDEAEQLCKELLQRYPEVIDGHDRLAMLHEAQGRFEEAATHYAEVLAIIERHREDYDPAMRDAFERRHRTALSKAQPQT